MLIELLFVLTGLLVGILLGGGIAWVIVAARAQVSHTAALASEQSKAATAEARVQETRQQLSEAKSECKGLNDELRKYKNTYAVYKTRLEVAEKNVKEQRELLGHAEARLTESFKSLAAQALVANNKGFLDLAERNFKAIKTAANADLDSRKNAIEALVKPVAETLTSYQRETKALEEKRLKEIGAVGEQLRSMAETQTLLHCETNRLVNALKSPQVRGRWGEITLKRTAELAGMTPHCDFVLQESHATEAGLLRPDMRVKLPACRDVVVDSKEPLLAFLEALEAPTEEQRCLALDRYAKQVANHVTRLAAKEYWAQFSSTPEFVVLFIPSDSFLAAAVERQPNLIESALGKKIVIATPSTLFALLRAIEHGWRQQLAVENALEISKLGQELSDRFAVLVDHLRKVGNALGKAVESYNSAIASFEGRILPQARRFKALGAIGKKEIEELQLVDATPRALANPDGENNGEHE